jgi:hypothetical protein
MITVDVKEVYGQGTLIGLDLTIFICARSVVFSHFSEQVMKAYSASEISVAYLSPILSWGVHVESHCLENLVVLEIASKSLTQPLDRMS